MHDCRSLVVALGGAAILACSSLPASAAEVQLDAGLSQSVIKAGASDRIYLRLSLKSLAPRDKAKRSPLNVALVLDRSGSMSGERLQSAKAGARAALDRLGPDDIVSLVDYNHDVHVLVPAARLGTSRDKLERAIDKLEASGTTALYAGVKEGGEQVKRSLSDMQVNRVILLSDGLANVGPSAPGELAELGRQLAGRGITVSTIGLGLEYNEDLMQRLAQASDGNHVFVERPSDLAEIFDRELGDALSIAAQDLTITIECKAGFKPTRVLGRDAEISGNRVTLKLNQLQAENERYVIVELDVPKGPENELSVAAVELEYLNLERGARERKSADVQVRVSSDAKVAEESLDKVVMTQVTEQIATENTEKAVELRDRGDVSAAKKALEENAAYLRGQRDALGSGIAAASAPALSALGKLEEKSREAANNLEGQDWEKTRKSMRHDQHKSKVQQAY